MNYTKLEISRSPKTRIFTSRITVILLAAFALLMLTAVSAFMAPPLPGAIFTTDAGCSGTNINIYPSKDAVWLDGGPAHPGAAGLAEGNYYIKVTEPDGTLLGSSIGGPLGDTPVHVNSLGEFDTCYQLVSIVSPVPGGGGGYNDTTNNGDEYKVWACTDAEFIQCKTDNFKVKSVDCEPGDPNCTPHGGIEVRKFYDADMDGEKDPGEAYLQGWKFDLTGPQSYSNPLMTTFIDLNAPVGIYTATERDTIETNWFASTDKTLSTVVVEGDASVIEFGNYCELTPGGHTIGFWSNKNGQNLEDAADFTELTGLCLRNADGSDKDFTGTLIVNKKSLNIWLLDAKATNMAYMLSAQLAATELSVNHGFTNPAIIVDGLDNVTALMAHANALLCADGLTKGGDPNRAEQERVKDILDKINNGGSFVQPNADNCPYTFLP